MNTNIRILIKILGFIIFSFCLLVMIYSNHLDPRLLAKFFIVIFIALDIFMIRGLKRDFKEDASNIELETNINLQQSNFQISKELIFSRSLIPLSTTKSKFVPKRFLVDDYSKRFCLVSDNPFGASFDIFGFKDLLGFELIENNNSITSSGILNKMNDTPKNVQVFSSCFSLLVNIAVNDSGVRSLVINFVLYEREKSDKNYLKEFECAQSLIGLLRYIENENNRTIPNDYETSLVDTSL